MIVILQQQISENAEPDAIIFFMKSETYFDDNWLLWCLRKDFNFIITKKNNNFNSNFTIFDLSL